MTTLKSDVCIIGTGAGGGVLADRLTELVPGLDVLMLEAGPHYTSTFFNQREDQMNVLFKNRGGVTTVGGAIQIMAGNCVGGSTAMYTGVIFPTPGEVLERWEAEYGVEGWSTQALAPHFAALMQDLNAHELPPDYINMQNRRFEEGCQKLGIPCRPLLIATKNCRQAAFCNLGCVNDAKQNALVTFVPKALSRGARLIANCRVESVSRGVVRAEVRPAPPGAQPNTVAQGALEVRCRLIVLAAGAMGSPELLMRSDLEVGSALGTSVTLHPALNLHALHRECLFGHRGFPKAFYTDAYSESHNYLLETSFYYPFTTAKNLPLFGESLRQAMENYHRMMSMLILVHDDPHPENRFVMSQRGAVLRYRLFPKELSALIHAQREAARIFFAAGCDTVFLPGAKEPVVPRRRFSDLDRLVRRRYHLPNLVTLHSAHPQGGCPMGNDPSRSVVNSRGQLHRHPDIFVADGSLFPTSVKVNPALSIMAFARRIADFIREDLGA